MKINIEIDVTPEEMRRFFGLPDVQPIQTDLMERFRAQVNAGTAELDPARMMEAFVTPTSAAMEAIQQAFLRGFAAPPKDEETK